MWHEIKLAATEIGNQIITDPKVVTTISVGSYLTTLIKDIDDFIVIGTRFGAFALLILMIVKHALEIRKLRKD
jgi:hypothetical protein